MGLAIALPSPAQDLPPPTATVYKCHVQGRVLYTDAPCPGAKTIAVTPPRPQPRAVPPAPAPVPLSAAPTAAIRTDSIRNDATPKEVQYRRFRLTPRERTECRRLDDALPAREAELRNAAPAERDTIEADVQRLRGRVRQLGC